MTFAHVLGFVMRALHVGATSVWLGSGLFYLLTRPTPGKQAQAEKSVSAETEAARAHSRTVRTLAGHSFALTVLSGVYLTFDRVANPRLGLLYVRVLLAKLAMVTGIALIVSLRPGHRQDAADAAEGASRPGWSGWTRWSDPGWQVWALGAGALLLGVLLTLIYEAQAGIYYLAGGS